MGTYTHIVENHSESHFFQSCTVIELPAVHEMYLTFSLYAKVDCGLHFKNENKLSSILLLFFVLFCFTKDILHFNLNEEEGECVR